MYPHPVAIKLKHLVDFTYSRAEEIVREKKAALEKGDVSGIGDGNDIINMLRTFDFICA